MIYKVKKKRTKEEIDGFELTNGYSLTATQTKINVEGQTISHIVIYDKELAYPAAYKKVFYHYDKVIKMLTNLLISDDDTGDSVREALNLIEKFRLEIKVKYRNYLKEQDLKLMAKQLKAMQKAALEKEQQIKEYLEAEYLGKAR